MHKHDDLDLTRLRGRDLIEETRADRAARRARQAVRRARRTRASATTAMAPAAVGSSRAASVRT